MPAELTAAWGRGDVLSVETATLITSQFLHGGWLHLLGNLLYLWIFANNVEDRLGRPVFLVFYLAGGVAAGLAQVAVAPSSTIPTIGASGAIAATLGAYLVLFPRARITSLVFLGFFYQLIAVPAVLVLGFWFVLQIIDGFASVGMVETSGGVAFFAHIGGFVAGALVARRAGGRPRPVRPAARPGDRGIIDRCRRPSSSRWSSRACGSTCCPVGTWSSSRRPTVTGTCRSGSGRGRRARSR